jgi:hypothetical protein
MILEETKNISGVFKFLVIKISVGLIVAQGLVAQFLIITGSSPYVEDDHLSAEEKTIRGYSTWHTYSIYEYVCM